MGNWCHNYMTFWHNDAEKLRELNDQLMENPRGYYMDIGPIHWNPLDGLNVGHSESQSTLVADAPYFCLTGASKYSPDAEWMDDLNEKEFTIRCVYIEVGMDFWGIRESGPNAGEHSSQDNWSDEIGGEPSDWRVNEEGLTWAEANIETWEQSTEETIKRFRKEDETQSNDLEQAEIEFICSIDAF